MFKTQTLNSYFYNFNVMSVVDKIEVELLPFSIHWKICIYTIWIFLKCNYLSFTMSLKATECSFSEFTDNKDFQ